jgi:predicted DNA-binding transcriptional regulator AlpA
MDMIELLTEMRDLLREIRDLLRPRHARGPEPGPDTTAPSDEDLLNEKQVASLLGVSTLTLRKWRWENKGPEWVKIERTVRYRRSAVDDWIKSGKK